VSKREAKATLKMSHQLVNRQVIIDSLQCISPPTELVLLLTNTEQLHLCMFNSVVFSFSSHSLPSHSHIHGSGATSRNDVLFTQHIYLGSATSDGSIFTQCSVRHMIAVRFYNGSSHALAYIYRCIFIISCPSFHLQDEKQTMAKMDFVATQRDS